MNPLDRVMKAKNLTLAALGRQVGVPVRQTMFKYYKGERRLPSETCQRIIEFSENEVTLEELVRLYHSSAPKAAA